MQNVAIRAPVPTSVTGNNTATAQIPVAFISDSDDAALSEMEVDDDVASDSL